MLENPAKQDESNKKEILKNAKKIEETMNLLSEKAKETIKEYYNKNEKVK